MAEQNRATLLDSLTTYFPDNVSELINPADLREFLTNFLDSALTSLDDKPKLPLYGFGVMSGQLYYNLGWNLLNDGSNLTLSTSGIISQDGQKLEIGTNVGITKWIVAGAWTEIENNAIEIRVDKQPGGILHIYPMIGGAKDELGNLVYTTGSGWGLLGGGDSTMSIDSQSDNQIVLSHSDCGRNPPVITPRFSAEVYTNISVSQTTTTINLLDSSGSAFTPANGNRITVSRLSQVKGEEIRVDPNELVVSNARINFFAIYQE